MLSLLLDHANCNKTNIYSENQTASFYLLIFMKQNAGTIWEDESWLEYHPNGRNFASENNSDVRRGVGGKDKMKP